jgi:hypothetical protein
MLKIFKFAHSGAVALIIGLYVPGSCTTTPFKFVLNPPVAWPKAEDVNGLSLNISGCPTGVRKVNGMQIGIFNCIDDKMRGAQFGIISNVTSDATGIQLAPVFNYANEMSGVSLALWNYTYLQKGVQLSPGVNYTGGSGRALQIGSVNWTDHALAGGQIGLYNYSGYSFKGVQLGIVNVCKGSLHGLQIGLVNIAHKNAILPVTLGVNWGY